MQVPPVNADEVGAFVGSGEHALHVVDEPLDGGERAEEAGLERPAPLGLDGGGGEGGYDGAELFVSGPVEEGIMVFGRGRCFLPVGEPQLTVASEIRLYHHPAVVRGPCASGHVLTLLLADSRCTCL